MALVSLGGAHHISREASNPLRQFKARLRGASEAQSVFAPALTAPNPPLPLLLGKSIQFSRHCVVMPDFMSRIREPVICHTTSKYTARPMTSYKRTQPIYQWTHDSSFTMTDWTSPQTLRLQGGTHLSRFDLTSGILTDLLAALQKLTFVFLGLYM